MNQKYVLWYFVFESVQPFEIIIASSYYKDGRKKGTLWQHNEKVTKALDFALEYSLQVVHEHASNCILIYLNHLQFGT